MKRILSFLLILLCLFSSALGEERRHLKYGMSGDDVLALQVRLTELGYYSFKQSGKFQERTQAAVRRFQKAHGLEQDGEASPALQELIYSPEALQTPTPAPTVTPTPKPTLNLYVQYSGKRLEFGSGGENVTRLQTRLQQLGYYNMEISGHFLGNTRNAVRAFQEKNRLKVDGIVGEETWNALFFDETALDAAATPRPAPPPMYRIEVDVTNQITRVFEKDEEGEYSRLIKEMICSTGTKKDPTPLGTFILNGRTARWCYFDQWDTHAQYWTRITSSIAFHSVIYTQPDEMALKVGSYTALGTRASHGCIRLLVDDARWIYDHCGEGTEVLIYEGISDPEKTQSLKPAGLNRSVMLPKTTPQPTQEPEYIAQEPPMPFKTLEMGSRSEAVYHLQCRLTELGYYKGTITGGYYEGTRDAVKAFQKDQGLTVDGKAGKITLNALYAQVIATPAPQETNSPTPESTFEN